MGPTLCDFKMLGDSMFVRLAIKHADQPPPFVGFQKSWGFCRSGKTSKELHDEVSCLEGSDNKVVVLIGTNDVINKSRSEVQLAREKVKVFDDLYKLKEKLKRKCSKIVWLTIPPIPSLIDGPEKDRYEGMISAANRKIQSFPDDQVEVVDIFAVFNGTLDHNNYFERFMGKGDKRRRDGIHWNDSGMHLAYEAILHHFKN